MTTPKRPPALPFSVFIIAFNEADRIARALDSVAGLADEIVVVDSHSTDATRTIAAAKGARVIERDWPGYGPQKRFAEGQCGHRWVMNLDADEAVTPILAAEIRALFAAGEPPLDGYVVRQADVLPGETAPPAFGHAVPYIRLYRRDRGRFAISKVHDVVEMDAGATIGRLKGKLAHYSVRSASAELAKLLRYAKALVDDLESRGKTLPGWRLAVEFPAAFIKAWLFRRYILRGTWGFLTAMNYAIFRHARVAIAVERRWRRRAGLDR